MSSLMYLIHVEGGAQIKCIICWLVSFRCYRMTNVEGVRTSLTRTTP